MTTKFFDPFESTKSSSDSALEEEPFVPSHGIVVVQFGLPHLVYHQGTDLRGWISDVGEITSLYEMVGDDPTEHPTPDGVYVWSGHVHYSNSYYGEWDAHLECTEFRPITQEEWKAFVADEVVWDLDEMHAYLQWDFRRKKADREMEEASQLASSPTDPILELRARVEKAEKALAEVKEASEPFLRWLDENFPTGDGVSGFVSQLDPSRRMRIRFRDAIRKIPR